MSGQAKFPAEFHSDDVGPVTLRDTDGSMLFSPLQGLRHAGEDFQLRDASGAATPKRAELLAKMGEGENVELEIDFRSFQQVDGEHNSNHLRFKKGILRALGRSFKGAPLIRDHETDDLRARAGTVTRSQAVKIDGGMAFDMTAAVTAPWAVEALLRGTLDRFSNR